MPAPRCHSAWQDKTEKNSCFQPKPDQYLEGNIIWIFWEVHQGSLAKWKHCRKMCRVTVPITPRRPETAKDGQLARSGRKFNCIFLACEGRTRKVEPSKHWQKILWNDRVIGPCCDSRLLISALPRKSACAGLPLISVLSRLGAAHEAVLIASSTDQAGAALDLHLSYKPCYHIVNLSKPCPCPRTAQTSALPFSLFSSDKPVGSTRRVHQS